MSSTRLYQGTTIVALLTAIVVAIISWTNAHVLDAITVPMPDCGSSIIPKQVVRVFIPSPPIVPNPTVTTRNVRYKTPDMIATGPNKGQQDEGAEEIDDGNNPGNVLQYPVSYGQNFPPPFHVDLTSLNLRTGDYVMFRIILTDTTNYSFYDQSTKNGIHGVGVADRDHTNMCGAALFPSSGTPKKVVVFYVLKGETGVAVDPEPYNIGLNVVNNDDTPIFIDPKVKNPG